MPLPTPILDDRTFDQLFADAAARARQVCPDWELTPGDPGVVLLDLFAHLTEVLIYRLNRVPEKAYVEFLNLLGVRLRPPTAAAVALVFRRNGPADRPLDIPRGTRVTVARATGSAPPPVFTTARAVRIEAGTDEARVMAYHAEFVDGELAGVGTGQPQLSIALRRTPIVAPTSEDLELVVGVEASDDMAQRERAVTHDGRAYSIWTEVDSFANRGQNETVFVADRSSGLVTFAPAVRRVRDGALDAVPESLAGVPGRGRSIRVWYWCGGGVSGNVGAHTLTVLRDSIPGVTVTNPERAAGGRDAESLDNALMRGPQEFRTLERAVTADDFEKFATASGGIARARAVAQAEVWSFATPGTVEVLMVPDVPADVLAGPLDAAGLSTYQNALARQAIQRDLDRRRPLGTRCLVNWARCKTVHVQARIVAYREEDAVALRTRFLKRLYETINPSAWRFGQSLRVSHIYDLLLAEPGVNYVDDVRFRVEDAPSEDVRHLVWDGTHTAVRAAAEAESPHGLWLAASGDGVYRSMNDAAGWERCARFPGESVDAVAAHPVTPGLVAAVAERGDGAGSALYLSDDSGEHWSEAIPTAFRIDDLAWTTRQGVAVLFLATHVGLYEIAMDAVRELVQVQVDATRPSLGFSAIAALTDLRGGVSLALAAADNTGVWLSTDSGRPDTFRHIGLDGRDIRVLTAQYDGPRAFLWAGFAASQGEAGTGAARLELIGTETSAEGWRELRDGWQGGSCWSLAFQGAHVYAASYQGGVLRLDMTAPLPAWTSPALACGLPLRGGEHIFQWVRSVAAGASGSPVLCGGPDGVFASDDGGVTFRPVSSPMHGSSVTLPPTWLFCSGEHDITVIEET